MAAAEERLRLLIEAKPNSWIALSGDESRIVGEGSSYEEAVADAAKNGEADPVLIKTPSHWYPSVM